MGLGMEIGVDLGTSSVLVYIRGKGIVLKEPSVVAVNSKTGKVLAVGESASLMLGRTPGIVEAIRPLREGVISDFRATEVMLKAFIGRVCTGLRATYFKPTIVVCVPSVITPVEQQAVENACRHAGAKDVFLIREPIAAAIGAGIDITKACGSMVVDIGGGTSEVAVISMGGIVAARSVRCAGDKFDASIINYIKKKYNLLIGERTAENIKLEIGSAFPSEKEESMEIKGRNLLNGLPENITINSAEIRDALVEPLAQVIDAIKSTLEETPPELSADIIDHGITLAGGGALLRGLDRLIGRETGMPVYIAEYPLDCVAEGTGKILENISDYQDALTDNVKYY